MSEERPGMAASASGGESEGSLRNEKHDVSNVVGDLLPLVPSGAIGLLTNITLHHKLMAALQKGRPFFVFTLGLKCPTLFMLSYDLPWGMRCGFSRGEYLASC